MKFEEFERVYKNEVDTIDTNTVEEYVNLVNIADGQEINRVYSKIQAELPDASDITSIIADTEIEHKSYVLAHIYMYMKLLIKYVNVAPEDQLSFDDRMTLRGVADGMRDLLSSIAIIAHTTTESIVKAAAVLCKYGI